jgi:DGQHR domain-containing protein
VLAVDRDVERYLGIQRPLSASRVNDLNKYVNFVDATFPTSIIIAIDQRCVVFDSKSNTMTVSNHIGEGLDDSILYRQIARVLDGQHRIDGLSSFAGEKFDLTVTIFVGIDIAQQAQIFSTVNLEQTKVHKSLAYDLFALASSRSPQKTCHNVVVALDNDEDGPFFQRIKRLGVATEGRYAEKITQSTFTESLIVYISRDPKVDRDRLLRGQKLGRPTAPELDLYPLRGFFIEEDDISIAEIVGNYFSAIRERWPIAWSYDGRGLILNRTNGFRAMMRIFGSMYRYVSRPGIVVRSEEFYSVFRRARIEDSEFNTENFPPGTSGESKLFRRLEQELGLSML